MKKNKENDSKDKNDIQRQIRLIHVLAKRLPWIVVFFVALTAIVCLIELFFGLV